MQQVRVENFSGLHIRSFKLIPPLQAKKHFVVDIPVGGDAPKDFIKVYQYGESRFIHRKKWPAYIAKVGHKWYPNESVTEHLLTRIGQSIGIRVADSCLMRVDGQIRFFSKYFLKRKESLVHGVQIFSGYLEDSQFVQSIVDERRSHELFTFQFIKAAVSAQFPENSNRLMLDFVKMLAYDALVGNNDRHHLNWGVIQKSPHNRTSIEFSPIYDTARAIFWNHSDERIRTVLSNSTNKNRFLKKYIDGSKPKTGWNGQEQINHFQIIQYIFDEYPEFRGILTEMGDSISIQKIKKLIRQEFHQLMIKERQDLIIECLELRLNKYQSIINEAI